MKLSRARIVVAAVAVDAVAAVVGAAALVEIAAAAVVEAMVAIAEAPVAADAMTASPGSKYELKDVRFHTFERSGYKDY